MGNTFEENETNLKSSTLGWIFSKRSS